MYLVSSSSYLHQFAIMKNIDFRWSSKSNRPCWLWRQHCQLFQSHRVFMNRHFSKNTVKNVFALKKKNTYRLYIVTCSLFNNKSLFQYIIFFFYQKHIKETSKDVSSDYQVDINFGFKQIFLIYSFKTYLRLTWNKIKL